MKTALIAYIAIAGSGAVFADETGRIEHINACAACHGMTGVGDAPLTELLTVPVSPLTGLSAANEGVFPMLDVIHVIDGRQGVRGRGRPMPLWGSQFSL